MHVGRTAFVLLVAAIGGGHAAGCAPTDPYVRYDGLDFGRKAKPVDEMEVLRAAPPAPPARYQDLGTVVVTCPSFGAAAHIGGCNYHWAVRKACESAAGAGADGIHTIETATNPSGATISLKASVFVRLPQRITTAAAAPPPPKPQPTVQERLRQLEALKKEEGSITPEEYQKKRAEILEEILIGNARFADALDYLERISRQWDVALARLKTFVET